MADGKFVYKCEIRGGRILAAQPLDEERLLSYPNGLLIDVTFKETKGVDSYAARKIRHWHALIGLAWDQTNLSDHYKSKEMAHELLKIECGIAHVGKLSTGQIVAVPRSLSDLDTTELGAGVDQLTRELQRITGVDPTTLKRQVKRKYKTDFESGVGEPDMTPDGGGRMTGPPAADELPARGQRGADDDRPFQQNQGGQSAAAVPSGAAVDQSKYGKMKQ